VNLHRHFTVFHKIALILSEILPLKTMKFVVVLDDGNRDVFSASLQDGESGCDALTCVIIITCHS